MSLPYSVSVNAEVDVSPRDVLNELNEKDIEEYLTKSGYLNSYNRTLINVDVMDYYHGDFNLKKFLREIGLEETRRILKELEEEETILIN